MAQLDSYIIDICKSKNITTENDEFESLMSFLLSLKIDRCDISAKIFSFLDFEKFIENEIVNNDIWDINEIKKMALNYAMIFNENQYINDKSFKLKFANATSCFAVFKSNISKQGLPKYIENFADELYNREIARKRMDYVLNNIKNHEKNKGTFISACDQIKYIYSLNDFDIQKLRYFINQVLLGTNMNPSCNKAIYIYSAKKGIGKTKIANCICSILNGYNDYSHNHTFNSDIPFELGTSDRSRFSPPLVAVNNAVVLDEAFNNDMTKQYSKLKNVFTSAGGRCEVKFRNTYQWKGNRNYFCCANDPIQSIVKDFSDRRFIYITMESAPKEKLTDKQIFTLFEDFIYNMPYLEDLSNTYANNVERTEVIGDYANNQIDMMDAMCRTDIRAQIENEPFLTCGILTRILEINFFIKKDASRRVMEASFMRMFGEFDNVKLRRWKKNTIIEALDEHLKNANEIEAIEQFLPF